MTRRAVWTIGVGQCVAWGVLYYAFGVLLVPVERELNVARWIVTGAFSLALLISAVAAPTVGKLTDRGHGPALMQAGGLVAAGVLAGWAAGPSVWISYLAWSAIGLCMASVLYEPVFAIVGRAIDDASGRLRAIATITVFGGFASTLFLPLTAWLVERHGWRNAVYALAAALAIVTVAVHQIAFRGGRTPMARPRAAQAALAGDGPYTPQGDRRLGGLILTFACSSFVSAGLATNLVPALLDRRLSATTAAMFAGLFGVMQLPGRLLIMNGRFSLEPSQMIWASLGLQVAGLAALIPRASLTLVAVGVTCFACGSGLATLARPYVVLVRFGAERAGHVNGIIARAQQLARAAGPVAVAALAAKTGYGVVFALLAGVVALATARVRTGRDAAVPAIPR